MKIRFSIEWSERERALFKGWQGQNVPHPKAFCMVAGLALLVLLAAFVVSVVASWQYDALEILSLAGMVLVGVAMFLRKREERRFRVWRATGTGLLALAVLVAVLLSCDVIELPGYNHTTRHLYEAYWLTESALVSAGLLSWIGASFSLYKGHTDSRFYRTMRWIAWVLVVGCVLGCATEVINFGIPSGFCRTLSRIGLYNLPNFVMACTVVLLARAPYNNN